MFPSLCGLALACTITGPPAQAVATTAIQAPPRIVEVAQQVMTRPRHRAVAQNPPVYLDQDQGCEQYNCIGPQTDFRLPNEIPYPEYERQFTGRPAAR